MKYTRELEAVLGHAVDLVDLGVVGDVLKVEIVANGRLILLSMLLRQEQVKFPKIAERLLIF